MSNIPLDFVGLNTLVKEEIDPDTNTIGNTNAKALKFNKTDEIYNLELTQSAGYSYLVNYGAQGYTQTGPLSYSFWIKMNWDALSSLTIPFALISSGHWTNGQFFTIVLYESDGSSLTYRINTNNTGGTDTVFDGSRILNIDFTDSSSNTRALISQVVLNAFEALNLTNWQFSREGFGENPVFIKATSPLQKITFNDDDIGGAISPIRTPLLYRIIGFDTTGDSFFGIIKDDYLLHTPGLADGGNNTEFIFRHSASDGTIKTATWELNTYLSGLDWAGWDDWAHIVVSWDGNFNNSVILYVNGINIGAGSQNSVDKIEKKAISQIAIGFPKSIPTVTTYHPSSLNAEIKHVATYNKTLNQNDIDLIYSNGFVENIAKISTLKPFIIDYWKFGDDLSLNFDDTIQNNTDIEPSYGINTLRTVNTFTISKGLIPEIRNKEVLLTKVVRTRVANEYFTMNPDLVDDDGNVIYVDSTNQVLRTNGQIEYEDYLIALNIHRNGPYGYSSFKQIRAHENPVTRYHKKNNIFSFSPEEGFRRTVIKDGKVISQHTDKRGPVTNFENESPVIMNKKPFEAIVDVFIEQGGDQFEEKVKLKTSYASQLDYFNNEIINQQLGLDEQRDHFYEEMKSLYMGVDPESSIVTGVDSVKLSQTIFPTDLYTNKSFTKQRPSFNSNFWRKNRNDRILLDQDNGFGYSVPSQSMWPLDAVANFETQTLIGSDGNFRIFSPSLAKAINDGGTVTNASRFTFPESHPSTPGSIFSEVVNKGSLAARFYGRQSSHYIGTNEVDGLNVKLKIEPAIAHLYDGFSRVATNMRTAFVGSPNNYDSTTDFTLNTYTRKGAYIARSAGLHNSSSPQVARVNYMRVKNIYLDNINTNDSNARYRAKWLADFRNCTLSYWNAAGADSSNNTGFGTLMIDFSSSKSPVAHTGDGVVTGTGTNRQSGNGPGALSISGSGDIDKLRRHIFFATSSVNVSSTSGGGTTTHYTTTTGDNMLVVRLGTKWTKDPSGENPEDYYGNVSHDPALGIQSGVDNNGAVDFIFDGIFSINNPLKQTHHSTTELDITCRNSRYLTYIQSHFLVSLKQNLESDAGEAAFSASCYLAINGKFIAPTRIVDPYGFLSRTNYTDAGGVEYAPQTWTAKDVEPTDVIWFQGGDGVTKTSGGTPIAEVENAPTNFQYFSDIALFKGSLDHSENSMSETLTIRNGSGASQDITLTRDRNSAHGFSFNNTITIVVNLAAANAGSKCLVDFSVNSSGNMTIAITPNTGLSPTCSRTALVAAINDGEHSDLTVTGHDLVDFTAAAGGASDGTAIESMPATNFPGATRFSGFNNSSIGFVGKIPFIAGTNGAGGDEQQIGVRYVDYNTAMTNFNDQATGTPLEGPYLWYNFENNHRGEASVNQYDVFGFEDVSVNTAVAASSYDYLATMGYLHGDLSGKGFLENQNIPGLVGPITTTHRLNNGSFADFIAAPGDNLATYTIEQGLMSDYSPASNFNSPVEPSIPLGGFTGDNSRQGPGVLQNSYSQFARGLTTSTPLDLQLSASAFYSRRHTLTASTSVVNPFFTNLSGGTIHGITASQLYLGTALWEAPQQAGFFNNEGTFVSASKDPFYDTYGEYAEEITKIGKGYSVVPEFRISTQIEHYLSQGPLASKNDFLELTGGLSTLQKSSQNNFYKIYTNSEFIKHFKVVRDDHKKMFDPYKITLSCKAIKKFLPYKGFYPAERTVEMAKQFYSSYGSNVITTASIGLTGNSYFANQTYPVQYLLNPLFGPGVLYNTIKSGIACDYPVITSSMNTTGSVVGDYHINDFFDTRIPFEALVEPEKYLANNTLFSNEPDPNGNTFTEVAWNGQGNNLYKLQMNNFLAEVGEFFLENQNYTTITSLPQGDPNFGNAEAGKVYSMRLKMFRTITGQKSSGNGPKGIKYGLPQDTGSMSEAFTMYSRPSAFGPPTKMSASSFTTKAWNKFKKQNSVNFLYNTASTYVAVTSSNPNDGYNWPFTPPYYHGEAWADITFVPPSAESKKYTLPEIINNSSVEFCRYFEKDHTPGSAKATVTIQTLVLTRDIKGVDTSTVTVVFADDAENPDNKCLVDFAVVDGNTTITITRDGDGTTCSRNALKAAINDGSHADLIVTGHSQVEFSVTNTPTDGTNAMTAETVTFSGGAGNFFSLDGAGNTALFNSSSFINNELAMQIASSMNIFSKGVLRQDITEGGVTVETQFENKYRWIMQSKFECPTLNFNHHSHDTITMPSLATSSVPIGMWHQYGRLPQSTNEGIFLQVEELPENWIEGALGMDANLTGSLLDLCGFSTDPIRVGEVKESKLIEEAVVAIPFIADENYNRFFNLPKKDVRKAIKGQTDQVGETISNLVTQQRKYVFPPQFDFVNFKNVDPIVMYVFEFSHSLSRQDLADIWQNLPPKVGLVHEVSTASISHELFAHEFFGKGAKLTNTKNLQKVTDLSKLEDKIQWMVFKVKKRARNNYFEKMFDRNESGADITSEEIVATALGKRQKISYNWPYDFFSLVELIKIDAGIEFGNVDKNTSLELDDIVLQTTPPTSKT